MSKSQKIKMAFSAVQKKPLLMVKRWKLLSTPESNRLPRASHVAALSDSIVNEGPKAGGEIFTAIKREGETLVMTQKLVKALQSAGMWGKYPLNTSVLASQDAFAVQEAVVELLK
ncbi:MAG: hypothetical protein H7328_05200 [Bdellovibrio sp.]|nr:hypothetical protein [Bdellovibrio sp.]